MEITYLNARTTGLRGYSTQAAAFPGASSASERHARVA